MADASKLLSSVLHTKLDGRYNKNFSLIILCNSSIAQKGLNIIKD